MKLIEITEGSTLPENVIYYNRNGYTHGIQFEEADIEVYWTDLIKQAEKLANKVGGLDQRNCFWKDVSNYIKPRQSHINWTKVYNHNLKDCKSINNVKSIFFKGNFKGWNLTGIVDSCDRTKFYLEHMGKIWVDESGSYNNQGEPKFDGQWDFLSTFRHKLLKPYLHARKMKAIRESKRGVTPIGKPFNFENSNWEFKGWGYTMFYKRGERPSFFLPKEIITSAFGDGIILHGVDLSITNKEGSYNDMRYFFDSYTQSTYKFKKGQMDLLITTEFYPYLFAKQHTITNGGAHFIYVYDITNIDMSK